MSSMARHNRRGEDDRRLRGVHPHQLRHGFASNVMDAGGALDEAQELLGHARVASTQIYLHPSPQRLRAAVERVAASVPASGDGR
jgi:integrase/recombinase XerD